MLGWITMASLTVTITLVITVTAGGSGEEVEIVAVVVWTADVREATQPASEETGGPLSRATLHSSLFLFTKKVIKMQIFVQN